MKKLSTSLLAKTITEQRKALNMTQQQLADATGINRAMISRMESMDFIPSIQQLEALGETLQFEPTDLFVNRSSDAATQLEPMNIAVAGTGYVGLSIATLLAQHNHVTAVDITHFQSSLNAWTANITGSRLSMKGKQHALMIHCLII